MRLRLQSSDSLFVVLYSVLLLFLAAFTTPVLAGPTPPVNCENVTDLRDRANNSDSRAQLELAKLYFDGQCVAIDRDEAAKWLGRSVKFGNSDAQALLAVIMHVAKQDKDAANLAALSAKQGSGEGEALLAYLYANGEGLTQDDLQAAKWATLASQKNVALAEVLLADFYRDGRGGLPRDLIQADIWLIIAGKTSSLESDIPQLRSQLENWMTKAQVIAAEEKAATWRPQ